MSEHETKYEETLLASVVIEEDSQLALTAWKRDTWRSTHGDWTTDRGWNVGLFDSDGNAVATLGRIEGSTSVAAVYESSAWKMFLSMVPRATIGLARNKLFFDLGSGPERTKA